MNILESRKQAKLEKMLDSLNLSPVNRAMAQEYLLGETDDETLLKKAEPVNFVEVTGGVRQMIAAYLDPIRNAGNQELVARFYKLFWAMGKGTAAYALEETGAFRPRREKRSWCIDVLGKPAVAAMEATELTWNSLRAEANPWLHLLARTEPEVLQEAQSLSGTPNDNMAIVLAGILLCHAKSGVFQKILGGSSLIRRQSELLYSGNRSFVMDVCECLTDPDRKLLADYIQRGDVSLPVPDVDRTKFAHRHFLYISSDAMLVGLLGTASFLAKHQCAKARCAVRMHAALNATALLSRIFRVVPQDYLLEELDSLAEDLPNGAADLLLHVAQYHVEDDLKMEITKRFRAALPRALELADSSQYVDLTRLFPDAFQAGDQGIEERIIVMLKKVLTAGGDELKAYLKDTGSLCDSAKALENVSVPSYSYQSQTVQLMGEYRRQFGWNDFTCRCAVVQGLVFDGSCMGHLVSGTWQMQEAGLREMVQALLDRDLPAKEILNILGGSAAYYYDEDSKKMVREVAGELLGKPQYVDGLCLAAGKGNALARQMAISALDDLTKYAECADAARKGLLACAGDSSKQVKELLAAIFTAHREWSADYAAMLRSKKAAERLLAVSVLGKIGEKAPLEAALAAEKSAKVADAIHAVLGQTAPPAASGGDLVEQVLKGNKARKIQWLLNAPLPALHKCDDAAEISEDHRAALLVAYCELGRIGRSENAAQLAANIVEADLAALAHEVYELWLAAGAQSKQKWVLAFAAVFGGPSMTPKLVRAINDWPQHARGAIACDAVMALALSSDPAALLAVDSISRKFKFRQVKNAAAAALENAAQELGITAEELADRIVPDLGFGADGKRVFDYGSRSFTVRLTPTLELEITNHLGKAVKNLPAPGKTDDGEKAPAAYEAFKTMKKQIRTTISAQKARLEAALSVQRCWDSDAWQALFVRNPIMHQFAISLIWGVYADGKLETTFRYMEDGSFNTVDEDEYELPAGVSIGLVHPVELDAESMDGWKQQLEDYEITQSIQQLDRPVYPPEPEMSGVRVLERFGGKQLNGLSLAGKLLGMGWFRGSVQDGGVYATFYREDTTLGIGVELSFSGSYVGDENDTVTVYDAVFYKPGTVKRGSYVYDQPKEADIFALGDIPERYYSEIIYQLERATASSTETDENWKNNR